MVLVSYRFRAYVCISMSFSTRSHSSPEEYYSTCVHRKLICACRIRVYHPQRFGIAKSLHMHLNWYYICIQQFNAQVIDYLCDIIHIHSQWLKVFIVVHSPPLINMLKFNGHTLTVHETTSDYIQHSYRINSGALVVCMCYAQHVSVMHCRIALDYLWLANTQHTCTRSHASASTATFEEAINKVLTHELSITPAARNSNIIRV